MKLVVLGKGRIGKSTLVNFLKHCNTPTMKVGTITDTHMINLSQRFYNKFMDDPSKFVPTSTIGIDRTTIKMSTGVITVWDFAGQLEYTVTHQYFLSSEVWITCKSIHINSYCS